MVGPVISSKINKRIDPRKHEPDDRKSQKPLASMFAYLTGRFTTLHKYLVGEEGKLREE